VVVFSSCQIKSAIGNTGIFDEKSDNILFCFAGKNAKTGDQNLLDNAQQQLDAGIDTEIVRKETGWYKGVDKKMRFEISDNNARLDDTAWDAATERIDEHPLRKMNGYLGDYYVESLPHVAERLGYPGRLEKGLLIHPELFDAYPELSGVKVEIRESNGYPFKVRGHLSPGKNKSIYLEVNPSQGGDAFVAVLHEVQHVIQIFEQFAQGGSVNSYNDEFKDKIIRGMDDQIRWSVELKNGKPINELQDELEALGWDAPDTSFLEWLRDEANLSQYEIDARVNQAFNVGGHSEVYWRLAGEVEARNTEARASLSDMERKSTPPGSTADTKDSNVIVLIDSDNEESTSRPSL